jgi:hypothetical protein
VIFLLIKLIKLINQFHWQVAGSPSAIETANRDRSGGGL